jgi:hypothetical protein
LSVRVAGSNVKGRRLALTAAAVGSVLCEKAGFEASTIMADAPRVGVGGVRRACGVAVKPQLAVLPVIRRLAP